MHITINSCSLRASEIPSYTLKTLISLSDLIGIGQSVHKPHANDTANIPDAAEQRLENMTDLFMRVNHVRREIKEAISVACTSWCLWMQKVISAREVFEEVLVEVSEKWICVALAIYSTRRLPTAGSDHEGGESRQIKAQHSSEIVES